MATKAESFLRQQERSGDPKAPAKKRPRRDVAVDTSKPGVSATDRKSGAGEGTARRNRSARAAKKASSALEGSASGRPSRKSTRKSANRSKPTTNLQLRATRKARSAKTRARNSATRSKKR